MAKTKDTGPIAGDRAGKEGGLSVVATGMKITGHLDTKGVVKVEGEVLGSVRAEKQVLVARGGLVDGDILTREAVIGGEVRGAIYADERVEIQATSVINGDITTKSILVQEGGELNGHLKMADPQALARKPTARKVTEPTERATKEPNGQEGQQQGKQQHQRQPRQSSKQSPSGPQSPGQNPQRTTGAPRP